MSEIKTSKTMSDRDLNKVTSTQRVFKIVSQVLLYLFLGVMALIVIFPFYWMIISSVKSVAEYELPIPTIVPKTIVWSNYAAAIKAADLYNLFKNTVIVGVVSTLLSLVIFGQWPPYTYYIALGLMVIGAFLCANDEPLFGKKKTT